jgi:SAM-dependent methyltransferase
MVIEHLSTPQRVIEEVARVLRPGGRFVLHTPNRRFYQIRLASLVPEPLRRRAAGLLEGRPLDDVYPTRYRLNTPEEIERCARMHGLHVDSLRLLNSGIATRRLGVLAIPELLIARLLESERFASARSNIIAILEKPRLEGAVAR